MQIILINIIKRLSMKYKFLKEKSLVCLALIISCSHANSYENKDTKKCDPDIQQYIFSWALSNQCDDKPRGGTSKGVEITKDPNVHSGWLKLKDNNLSKMEKDRLAILAMAGPYKVDFNFLETVGFSENYKRDKPYHSWGTEYVYVLEDKPEYISLQHVMVMNFKTEDGGVSEPMVMKHWRQDWTYQDETLMVYQGDNSWKKQTISSDDAQGKWSQAVFQVDDSPRYESIGRWDHNPSFSSWISETTQRPLPRREYSVRKDYQILEGFNRHTINRFGWVQEEENWKKAINTDGSLKGYLAKEEGIGRYQRIIGTDFKPGDAYMAKAGLFWADVRLVWQDIFKHSDQLALNKSVDGVPLFMPLFEYAGQVMEADSYDSSVGQAKAQDIIAKHIR